MSLPLPEYEQYDAVGLAELVRRGEVAPSELLDAAVARTAERNPFSQRLRKTFRRGYRRRLR